VQGKRVGGVASKEVLNCSIPPCPTTWQSGGIRAWGRKSGGGRERSLLGGGKKKRYLDRGVSSLGRGS